MPTTNVAKRTPVLPVTVHDGLEATRPAADGAMVQDVSVDLKPVPEMDTSVPASAPKGGEP